MKMVLSLQASEPRDALRLIQSVILGTLLHWQLWSLCDGVKLGSHGGLSETIDSIPFAPNGQLFYTRYARQSRPVLIKGAAAHWPAVKNWANVTFLTEKHGNDVFTVEYRKQFESSFPIRKNMKLSTFLEQYQKKNIYLDSLFRKESMMINDVYLPLPLVGLSHKVSVDNLNLLISSGNTSSAFHQDGYENLLTVVSGYKDVILYDNKYTKHFDADNYNIAAGVLDFDPENLGEDDLGKLLGIPYYTVRIEPGDTLYIPKYWWHQVRSFMNPNIAVGMWFDIFNFEKEFREQALVEEDQIVKKTEVFMDLLAKEPLFVDTPDLDDPSVVDFMSPNKQTAWTDICSQLRRKQRKI